MSFQAFESKRIDELDQQIYELEQRLNALRRERNRCTPLGRLPSEILVMICEIIHIPETPHELASFTGSFSDVYYAVISAPQLWTSLNHLQGRKWRKACLARSKGLPIHVNWKIMQPNDRYGAFMSPSTEDIFPLATSATLFVHVQSSRNIPLTYLDYAAPLLRSLRTVGEDKYPCIEHTFLGGQLQHLNTLELDGVELGMHGVNSSIQWHGHPMQRLAILDCEGYLSDIRYMLDGMPYLEFLQIQHYEIIDTPPWSSTVTCRPLALLRLRALQLETNIGAASFLFSFIPNPSQCLSICLDEDSYDTLLSVLPDSTAEDIIRSRVRDFWDAITGSHTPFHLKVILRSGEGEVQCIETAGASYDWAELSSLACVQPSFFSTPAWAIIADPSLAALIMEIEFDLQGDFLALRHTGGLDIDLLISVEHICMIGAFWASVPADEFLEDDLQELEDWVRQKADTETPLRTIAFKDTDPMPDFTQRLMDAGGPGLRITWT
jgi:hypothetical protein